MTCLGNKNSAYANADELLFRMAKLSLESHTKSRSIIKLFHFRKYVLYGI